MEEIMSERITRKNWFINLVLSESVAACHPLTVISDIQPLSHLCGRIIYGIKYDSFGLSPAEHR